MVDTQTSTVSSRICNTSRRYSFAGDPFIKIKEPPATCHTYGNVHFSELADLIAEILKDQHRPTGCRVTSYINTKIDSRFEIAGNLYLKKVIPQDKSITNKSHSGNGDPPTFADPGCPPSGKRSALIQTNPISDG
ncbi:hypothetical protein DPMN_170555 [Dreissena polymorpha]|uniref:Uncharacterized protein n=1 Tax=Dreissena polymorpha TaxID=45954 RepID=A0A9D4DZH3_DREPO|nr:hypothetical protein DPMN_170555 [Dreissena polymorpha]